MVPADDFMMGLPYILFLASILYPMTATAIFINSTGVPAPVAWVLGAIICGGGFLLIYHFVKSIGQRYGGDGEAN